MYIYISRCWLLMKIFYFKHITLELATVCTEGASGEAERNKFARYGRGRRNPRVGFGFLFAKFAGVEIKLIQYYFETLLF